MNPEYAIGFVMRAKSAMVSRVSLRRNSPSYSDERKASEAVDTEVILGRNRNPIAYSGLNALESRKAFLFADPEAPSVRRVQKRRPSEGIRSEVQWKILTANALLCFTCRNSAIE